ncbi:MAG: hypothetical protein ACNA8R_04770 [Nitriliruptoraceae bacterium]
MKVLSAYGLWEVHVLRTGSPGAMRAACRLDEQQLGSLQVALEEAASGDERCAVGAWVTEHQDLVDGWLER